jgi:hypothetical protein
MISGRNCPLDYRYSPAVFRASADVETDTLYVVGGLYGNEASLDKVREIYDAEQGRKHLIFNGDFNWFNIAADSFIKINETVLQFDATRGNVEAELVRNRESGEAAGCGCAYPGWVDQGVVDRSNAIMQQLAQTADRHPQLQKLLSALPLFKRIDVGGLPVAVVHGDAQSLSGWGFATEHLSDIAHLNEVRQWFDGAEVRIFACTHTCSPVFKAMMNSAGATCLVANNGAAGMPNFSNQPGGLMTRIATTPCAPELSVYGTRIEHLYVDAVAIPYDAPRWKIAFLTQWPPGSPAYESYWERIAGSVAYCKEQAWQTAEAPSESGTASHLSIRSKQRTS